MKKVQKKTKKKCLKIDFKLKQKKKKKKKKRKKKRRLETWCAGVSWVGVGVGEEGDSWPILHHKCYLEIWVMCLISDMFIVLVCYLLKW